MTDGWTEAILADDQWLRTSTWILTITLPCREWYAEERKRVRNRGAALRFNIEYACGGFLKAVNKILDFSFHDLSSMLLVENLYEVGILYKQKLIT